MFDKMGNRERAKEFLQMAVADATAAMTSNDPYSICFHCQQEVEKYLKAYLAFHGKRFKKIHDLSALLEKCISVDPSFSSLRQDIAIFRPYAVKIRYLASKAIAERDCPFIWGTSMKITKTVSENLPHDLLAEAKCLSL
ncbi:MAG: HEPN domain-containing protein [Thermodesulfobacteriota bacterium]